MSQFYDFSSHFTQPVLELREPPQVMIHASSRSDLNENLVIAAELNHEINHQYQIAINCLQQDTGSDMPYPLSSATSPFSFYIMQRCCPAPAVRAAIAEGTHYIISLCTRSDTTMPSKGGQTIEYATTNGQLLAAYLQQGLASCPYVRRLPTTQLTTDESNIATVAAKEGIHAVRLICGYTTNYFDSHLLNSHRDSFISAIAKATFKFLTNNPIKAVKA